MKSALPVWILAFAALACSAPSDSKPPGEIPLLDLEDGTAAMVARPGTTGCGYRINGMLYNGTILQHSGSLVYRAGHLAVTVAQRVFQPRECLPKACRTGW